MNTSPTANQTLVRELHHAFIPARVPMFLLLWLPVLVEALPAQTSAAPWRYTLIHGATLTDDCPICGRPALVLPLRGTFDLRLIGEGPLLTLAQLPPPAVADFALNPKVAGWRLEWTGNGRFFQVLGSPAVGGPYAPVAPVQTGQVLERADWLAAHPDSFFKVRQW